MIQQALNSFIVIITLLLRLLVTFYGNRHILNSVESVNKRSSFKLYASIKFEIFDDLINWEDLHK